MTRNHAPHLHSPVAGYVFYNIYKFLQGGGEPKIAFSHKQPFMYVANRNIGLEVAV